MSILGKVFKEQVLLSEGEWQLVKVLTGIDVVGIISGDSQDIIIIK